MGAMKNLTELPEWQALGAHQPAIAQQHMRHWFANDPARAAQFNVSAAGIRLDYSRNRIDQHTISLLCHLAQAVELPQKIHALIAGQLVNSTHKLPALHTALRDQAATPIHVQGENIAPLIALTQQRIYDFVHAIHSQTWRGATGKTITHIVNIGIGGSHLGPMMSVHALKEHAVSDLQFHFLSTIDHSLLNDILHSIDAEKTLFIISSKSFSTLETLTNARTIMNWLQQRLGKTDVSQHFIAITAAKQKALAFGIAEQHIFPLWDWVGGRYSIWSAIGLPLLLLIGQKQFSEFLSGAYAMDQHFQQAPFKENMPILMALLSIWYINFFAATAQVIAPYSYRLRDLVPYLQQAEMESNGKSTNLQHAAISYMTGPIIFGAEGCNAQHSYHQLLHQGQRMVPVDFLLLENNTEHLNKLHHDILLASGLSQAQALMRGKTYDEAYQELVAADVTADEACQLAQHQVLPGNRPSNILFLSALTPKTMGALLALYEHKIFVEGAIWGINSFDQWGVELGKQLLPTILQQIQA
jgi:glucose-6-phosphate isomerase